MTLGKFLMGKTSAKELCIIREDGWITCAVWIDNEDLWSRCLPSNVCKMEVKGDEWGFIPVKDKYGDIRRDIPCHYIDI